MKGEGGLGGGGGVVWPSRWGGGVWGVVGAGVTSGVRDKLSAFMGLGKMENRNGVKMGRGGDVRRSSD